MNTTKVILGTLNFDYESVSESFNQEKIDSMLTLAQAHGIDTLDTAYYYGRAEEYLGRSGLMSSFIVNSKANPWHNNDFATGQLGQLGRGPLLRQVNESLTALGIESFGTYYMHSWDYETPIEETLEVLEECYRKERFNFFGVSNISMSQVEEIVDIVEGKYDSKISPKVYQGMYNMYCRNVEELLPILREYDIKFECYNPLAGGLLTGKYYTSMPGQSRFTDNAIYQSMYWNDKVVMGTRDLTADLSLRWLRNHSKLREEDAIVIGCSTQAQLESNMASLSNETLLTMEELSIVSKFYDNSREYQPNYFY
jgi:aflatoxin B1 aldehyde reductase